MTSLRDVALPADSVGLATEAYDGPPSAIGNCAHLSRVFSACRTAMSSLIQCDGIWKQYRVGDVEVNALKDLSITIEPGEFVAVMGASGSGKSTLLNILGCLDRPSQGQYRLNGLDVGSLGSDQLADVRN